MAQLRDVVRLAACCLMRDANESCENRALSGPGAQCSSQGDENTNGLSCTKKLLRSPSCNLNKNGFSPFVLAVLKERERRAQQARRKAKGEGWLLLEAEEEEQE